MHFHCEYDHNACSFDFNINHISIRMYEYRQTSLRHWTSSDPDTLPGVFAQPTEGPSFLQHNQHHGLAKHLAVERSGSKIPLMLDDAGGVSRPSQMSQAWAAAKARLAGVQQPAQDAPRPKADSQVSEQHIGSSQPEAAQNPGLQSTGWDIQQDRQSQQPIPQQPSHANAPKEVEECKGESKASQQQDKQSRQYSSNEPSLVHAFIEDHRGEGQPAGPQQLLRHRSRSRLRLTQGGVAKGIMSFAKHHSGRVSPEKSALLPSRQRSSGLHLDDSGQMPGSGLDYTVSAQHLKLKTAALVAMKPNTGRLGGSSLAAARPAAKACLTAKGMLSSSLQQVQACTALLEQQHVQQQQLQRSVQAMTAKTIAMLDQAVLAAVHAQQHADAPQQRHN